MVSSLRTCVISVPISERNEVAESAIRAVTSFALYCEDTDKKARFAATPGMLSSLASLCGEESLLRNSYQMIRSISISIFCLSVFSPTTAAALIKAGWADLLVRALRIRPDNDINTPNVDKNAIKWGCWTINKILRSVSVTFKIAFVAAGGKAALKETMERYSRNSLVKKQCKKALKILMKHSHRR
mmetsp:Transcript_5004/g.6908  ORF Transcript_5004/g.6908 Transcript_5004/m.6908 type:complete len:186 (+) Transcript_5004:435-992(+)